MEQAKIITRTTFPKKQGIPINPPFSKETQKFIPKLTGKIHDVERNENGDIIVSRVAYKIEPGKSLRLAKMKDEMENAYKMADIIKQNVIIKKKKELPVPVPVPVKEESNSPSSPKLSEKEIERQAREFLKEEENAALKIFKQRKKNEEKKEAKKKRNTKTANLRKTIGRIMANGTRKRKPKHLS